MSNETVLLSESISRATLTRTSTDRNVEINNNQFVVGSETQTDYQVNATGVSRLHVKKFL